MVPYFRKLIFVLFFLGLLLGVVPHNPVSAVGSLIFNVNTTDDGPDFEPNGVCSVGHVTDGPCSLRAALAEAYGNLENVNYDSIIINLAPETYHLTISPDMVNNIHTGDLDIPNTTSTSTITITTNNPLNRAVIDGNQLDRVFRIGNGVRINLENLVVRGGLLLMSTDSNAGAGILNYGILNLDNVIIENNEARCQIDDCEHNIAGGAIFNDGSITMSQSTIQNNSSKRASAIFNAGGNVVILNSTIAHNHATKLLTMINYSNMHIRNSTISNNTAGSTDFHYVGITNYAHLVVESSTFANAGAVANILNSSAGDVTIKDSILLALPAASAKNCNNSGTWNSLGYNIFSDATCPATGTGDLTNTDPLLGFLGSWGGLTMTRPLKHGSPANNHRPETCKTIPYSPELPANEPITIDQRYFGRVDGECDTGAFEGSLAIVDIFLPLLTK